MKNSEEEFRVVVKLANTNVNSIGNEPRCQPICIFVWCRVISQIKSTLQQASCHHFFCLCFCFLVNNSYSFRDATNEAYMSSKELTLRCPA